MINTIEDLQNLVRQGRAEEAKQHGWVTITDTGFGFLFNYTPKAAYENNWTPFERMSRGLILGYDGSIVARPFDKFFNWRERGRTTNSPISYVMEKMDGSMGSIFRNPITGEYQVATRGSVESEQARWATEKLKDYTIEGSVASGVTLIVEIIYPENRIIVDYGSRSGLVLLAARYNETGHYFSQATLECIASACKMRMAPIHAVDTPEQLLSLLPKLTVNEEGFVAVFKSGERFKFKGDAYKLAHKNLSGVSYSRTIQYVMDDEVDTLLDIVPDEWLDMVKQWLADTHEEVGRVSERVENYLDANLEKPAKELVEILQEDKVSKTVFSCVMKGFRGHPYKDIILKEMKKDASKKSLIFGG